MSAEPVDDHATLRCQQHVAAARAACIVRYFGLRLAPPAVLRLTITRDASINHGMLDLTDGALRRHGPSTKRAAAIAGSHPQAISLPLPRAATGCNVKPNAKMAATEVAAESLATTTGAQAFSAFWAGAFTRAIKGLPLFRPPTEAPGRDHCGTLRSAVAGPHAEAWSSYRQWRSLAPMLLCPSVAALIDRFHALKPVRAWSLIITLYGDAVVPRGGRLWLGSLTEIMDLFGIDAGHVRTAMSRLTSDGWLERRRIGRNSYYRLSSREEGSFAEATRRIYFGEVRDFDGHLRLALLGPGIDDRSAVRPLLDRAGFAVLSPMVYVGLADPSPPLADQTNVFFVTALPGPSDSRMAAAAWKLAPIASAYEAFVQRFSAIDAFLTAGGTVPPADALVARTLLIHEFRRVVLRDPALPTALLPADWPGRDARALAAQIYSRLVPASEEFLDTVARNEDGKLPPPQASFATRFEGAPSWRGRAVAL